MKRTVGLSVLLALSTLCLSGEARPEEGRTGLVWMSGEEISSTFAGKALAGLYPSERAWSETIGADGTTDYREGSNHWRGRWWVGDREFCFSYPPPGAGGCFLITRISANCFELYEHGSSAGGEELPPNIANSWNGRMWHADQPTTCEARPSV
jgi:hypothetical protein